MATNRRFLTAAERILRELGHPLSARDIYEKAVDQGELQSGGVTPIHSMRARLSQNIRRYGQDSPFVRVKANLFALREWNPEEYIAKPFVKTYGTEKVVCVPQSVVDKLGRFFGLSLRYEPFLEALAERENLEIVAREEAESNNNYKQLIAYILLRDQDGRILSYKRGAYSNTDSLLKGVLCIGFGGHVREEDQASLLGFSDAGIVSAAYRELAEELKGVSPTNLQLIGIINDDSSPTGVRHLGIVLEAGLPVNFKPRKSREQSINKLELLTEEELWSRYHELEFWSHLLCNQLIAKPTGYTPVIINSKRIRQPPGPIIITGEVGNGKTAVALFLSDQFQIPIVSTRACVANLIGEADFGTGDRHNFQERALQLVSTDAGISRLANEIESHVREHTASLAIIDGLRNLGTYNALKRKFPNLVLVYIDAPRDRAFEQYRKRSQRDVTISEYRDIRHHEVEKEVPLLKSRADVLIFNGGTLDDLLIAAKGWWDGEK